MVNRLIGHLGQPPLPLHRLDMDTSGLVLFAKSTRVVEAVAKQFRYEGLPPPQTTPGAGSTMPASLERDDVLTASPSVKNHHLPPLWPSQAPDRLQVVPGPVHRGSGAEQL